MIIQLMGSNKKAVDCEGSRDSGPSGSRQQQRSASKCRGNPLGRSKPAGTDRAGKGSDRLATGGSGAGDAKKKQDISRILQYLVFFMNFLFWVCGLTSIAIGIYVLVDQYRPILETLDFFLNPAIILILGGCVIFAISFLGCTGALRENVCMLKFFGLALFIAYICLVVLAFVIFLLFYSDSESGLSIYSLLLRAVKKYSENDNLKEMMDILQKELQCCGATSQGYKDWNMNPSHMCATRGLESQIESVFKDEFPRCSVPHSCCIAQDNIHLTVTCGAGALRKSTPELDTVVNTDGCLKKLRSAFEGHAVIIGAVIGAVIVPVCISITFSNILWKQIERQRWRLDRQARREERWKRRFKRRFHRRGGDSSAAPVAHDLQAAPPTTSYEILEESPGGGPDSGNIARCGESDRPKRSSTEVAAPPAGVKESRFSYSAAHRIVPEEGGNHSNSKTGAQTSNLRQVRHPQPAAQSFVPARDSFDNFPRPPVNSRTRNRSDRCDSLANSFSSDQPVPIVTFPSDEEEGDAGECNGLDEFGEDSSGCDITVGSRNSLSNPGNSGQTGQGWRNVNAATSGKLMFTNSAGDLNLRNETNNNNNNSSGVEERVRKKSMPPASSSSKKFIHCATEPVISTVPDTLDNVEEDRRKVSATATTMDSRFRPQLKNAGFSHDSHGESTERRNQSRAQGSFLYGSDKGDYIQHFRSDGDLQAGSSGGNGPVDPKYSRKSSGARASQNKTVGPSRKVASASAAKRRPLSMVVDEQSKPTLVPYPQGVAGKDGSASARKQLNQPEISSKSSARNKNSSGRKRSKSPEKRSEQRKGRRGSLGGNKEQTSRERHSIAVTPGQMFGERAGRTVDAHLYESVHEMRR